MPRDIEVLGIGEPLALFDPMTSGPLEEVEDFRLRIAGAELNALIGLSRLEHRTAYVAAVGDDPFGRLIRKTLDEEDVDTSHVTVSAGYTGIFVKERLDGEGRRVYYYRSGSAASRLSPEKALGALADLDPRVVLISGLTLGVGGTSGLSGAAVELLRQASADGRLVVFDANLRPGLWHGVRAREEFSELVPFIDYLLAGENEIRVLIDGVALDEAAQRLLDEGLKAVLVKRGRRGSTVFTPAGVTAVPAFETHTVDPIGAGDAYAAGTVAGLLRGWDVEQAAVLGSALGACAVTSTGDWESLPSGDAAAELVDRYSPVRYDGASG